MLGVKLRAILLLLAAAPGLARGDGEVDPGKGPGRSGRKACDAGDNRACVELGEHFVDVYFSSGSRGGHAKDADAAVALFRKACGRGDVAGCRQVGWSLDEGIAGHDPEKAREYYREACDKGDGGGCTLLADMMEKGHDVRRVAAESLALYQKACSGRIAELGCLSGCDNLGGMYQYGTAPLPEDRRRAVEMYDKACGVGCSPSCDKAADLLLGGAGVPEDAARAARLYERACNERFSPACASLSELYGKGRGVARDAARARRLLDRACTLSHDQVEACKKR
jgi:TPR repeat protein